MSLFTKIKLIKTVAGLFSDKDKKEEAQPTRPVTTPTPVKKPSVFTPVQDVSTMTGPRRTDTTLPAPVQKPTSLLANAKVGQRVSVKTPTKSKLEDTPFDFSLLAPQRSPAEITKKRLAFTRDVGIATLNNLASAVDFAATAALDSPATGGDFAPGIPTPKLDARREKTKQAILDVTQNLVDTTEEWQKKYGYKPTEDWNNSSTLEKVTNPKYVPETMRVLAPQIVSSVIPYAGSQRILNTVKPASFFLASATAGDVQREAESYGVSTERSIATGLFAGGFTVAFEGIVPANIFTRPALKNEFTKNYIKNLVKIGFEAGKSGVKEAGTELVQSGGELAARATYREVTGEEIGETAALSLFGGLFSGIGLDASARIVELAQNDTLSKTPFGLSIREVSDEEAVSIMNKPANQRTPEEVEALAQHKQAVEEKGNIAFIDDTLENQYAKRAFDQMETLELDEAPFEFADSEMESNYQDFLNLITNRKLNLPQIKESLLSLDKDRFVDRIVELGILDKKTEAGYYFYSQDMKDSEVFDAFIERILREDPYRLTSKKAVKALGLEKVEQKLVFEDEEMFRIMDRAFEEEMSTAISQDLTEASSALGVDLNIAPETIATQNDVVDLISSVQTKAKAEGVSQKEIDKLTNKLLKQAEKINRPATKTETRRAIKQNTEVQKSRMIRMRETTALKNRIRNYARGTREGSRIEREYQKAVADLRVEEAKGRLARKSEIQRLRQRIKDRERFVRRGTREGMTAERVASKDTRKVVRSFVRDSELTPDQKRRILASNEFSEITSRTDLNEKLESILAKIDDVTGMNAKLEVVKQIEKMFVEAERTAGKRPKGKLIAESQALIDWAFGANTGFNQTSRDNEGNIDLSRATEQITNNEKKIANEDLTNEKIFYLRFENAILQVAGALKYKKILAKTDMADLENALSYITDVVETGLGSRLEKAIKEDAEEQRVQDEMYQEAMGDEVITQDTIEQEATLKYTKKGLKARFKNMYDPIRAFSWGHYTLENMFQSMVDVSKIKDGYQFYKSESYKGVSRFLADARDEYNRLHSKFTKQNKNAMMTFIAKEDSTGSYRQRKRAAKRLTVFLTPKNIGTFLLAPDPDNGGKRFEKTFILSPNQMVSVYNWTKRDGSLLHLQKGNLYTTEILQKITEEVESNEGYKQYADWLRTVFYPEWKQEFSSWYANEYGVEPPDIPNYTPEVISYETVKDNGGLPQYIIGTTRTSHFKADTKMTESAKQETRLPALNIIGAVDNAMIYTSSVAREVTFTNPVRRLQRLLKRGGKYRRAILQKKGEPALARFELQLSSLRGDPSGVNQENLDGITKAVAYMAKSQLFIEPTQYIKQLTATVAWITEANNYENVGGLFIAVKDFLKSRKKWTKELREEVGFWLDSRGVKNLEVTARIDAQFNSAKIKSAAKKLADQKSYDEIAGIALTKGDLAAVMGLGVPFYIAQKKKYISEGMSEADAKRQAAADFVYGSRKTQSDTEVENLGSFQKLGPLGAVLNLFTTQAMQHTRIFMFGLRQATVDTKNLISAGRTMDAAKANARGAANMMAIWLSFAIFNMVANGLMGIGQREFDKERFVKGTLFGPLESLFIVGRLVQTVGSLLTNQRIFSGSFESMTGFGNLQRLEDSIIKLINEAQNVPIGENWFTHPDVISAINDVAVNMTDVFTGRAVGNAYDLLTRSIQYMNGDLSDPRAIVYSDYAMGIDSRQVRFDVAVEEKKDQLRRAFKNGNITEEKARTELNKFVNDSGKRYLDKTVEAMLAKGDPKEAAEYLKSQIRNKYINKEIGRRAAEKYNSKLRGGFDAQRIKQLAEIEERGIIENITTVANALGTDPQLTLTAALSRKEKLYKVEGGIVRLVRMPQAESEAIKDEWEKAYGTKGYLDHTIPLQLGGTNDIDNLRVLPKSVQSS